ncbi:Unannotated [Lentimonas sp. CC19]|nr:Unannotated [Lentimonas sp. CC4]CAA6685582.1 Unannotated [Lentimonas sp. CC6]CAA6689673.1 Unannotated [Lentimonas sp. CC19]CAA6692699.1 Unannotated [Lentimonas sp. CC10]CAA7069262.1 Unannotated [Lentimonas sp. CC11]
MSASEIYCPSPDWFDRFLKVAMNSSRFTGDMRTEPEFDSILIRFKDNAGALIGHEDASISLISVYLIFFFRMPDLISRWSSWSV